MSYMKRHLEDCIYEVMDYFDIPFDDDFYNWELIMMNIDVMLRAKRNIEKAEERMKMDRRNV